MNSVVAQPSFRGELRLDEPMSAHTTWRVGGPAERYFKPADLADLSDYLAAVEENEALFWLGLGSNLLVRDGGIRGTVIALTGRLMAMSVLEHHQLRVEAGVPCAQVARFSARNGLAGAEFLNGIPGTMGGALAMNAGCFGVETWERVLEVETMDRKGRVFQRSPQEFEVAYRHVEGPQGEWFVAALLQLQPGDRDDLQKRNKELLDKRGASQPTRLPNAGSVFRNPQNDFAGRLIEASGLKGFCIGKACVSEKHANFIVNTGEAKASDIEALIKHVQLEVEKMQGVCLQTEVKVIGEAL